MVIVGRSSVGEDLQSVLNAQYAGGAVHRLLGDEDARGRPCG